jgi:aspartate aminotransferase
MKKLKKTNGLMGSLAPSATVTITAKAQAMQAAGLDVCSMSAGEPDFDTPEIIKQAAIDALIAGKTSYTPSAGISELKQAIAEKLATDNQFTTTPEQIIVAPGAKFSVFSTIAALCGAGDEVIILAPHWVSYPEMVKASGAKSIIVNTSVINNYEPQRNELKAAITEKTKLLIINTPSNPTGAVYSKATLTMIATLAIKHNFMVLADEIYEKLVYDQDRPHISIASINRQIAELTITINGFSKAYAMTGWRIGYLTAPRWLVNKINAIQSNTTSNPTSFAQYGALKAITDGSVAVKTMNHAFAKRRDLIYKLINEIDGLQASRPAGAFYIFCNITSFGLSDDEFCQKLLEEKLVAAIPGQPFGATGNIRLSYACSETIIIEAIKRLKEFCKKL